MFLLLQKIPFLIELFFSGPFILLYSLKKMGKVPQFLPPDFVSYSLNLGGMIIPFVMFLVVVLNYLNSQSLEEFFRKHIFSLIILVPMIITIGDVEFTFWLSSAHLLSSILALYDQAEEGSSRRADAEDEKIYRKISPRQFFNLSPAQILIITFFGVVAVGTFTLMLPVSSSTAKTVPFIDALFQATSATCVTGLATINVGKDLSLVGQLALLALIQVGGLGFMLFHCSLTLFLGKNMNMRYRILMQDLMNVSGLDDLYKMMMDIIRFTFIIELWGTIVLTFGFVYEGLDLGKALYYGVFHSVSAFCNAGFSLFDNNLESFATNPIINFTICTLIIFGGLGFVVLEELRQMVFEKKKFVRFTVHSKVVLVTTALLLVSGTVIIFFGEFLNALDGYSLWGKLQIAFFQSTTLRTAGFNTIPLAGLHPYILYIMTIYMYIGGAPGSTAGGIKVTTFAVLVQSIRSTFKRRARVEIFDRNIPSETIVSATSLTFAVIFVATVFNFFLLVTEPEQEFLAIFFEVASASGTVGLSVGITPYLSFLGKFAIALLMFIGRVGPLTLVLAIGEGTSRGRLSYPDGKVMIG